MLKRKLLVSIVVLVVIGGCATTDKKETCYKPVTPYGYYR